MLSKQKFDIYINKTLHGNITKVTIPHILKKKPRRIINALLHYNFIGIYRSKIIKERFCLTLYLGLSLPDSLERHLVGHVWVRFWTTCVPHQVKRGVCTHDFIVRVRVEV